MASSAVTSASPAPSSTTPKKKRSSFWLYALVIAAAVLGVIFGFIFPHQVVSLKILATGFVNLIKMLIVPIIFTTIVLGIGSIAKAATVGKIGGLALLYFIIMSFVALVIGLTVGNIIKPGEGLDIGEMLNSGSSSASSDTGTIQDFVLGIIPDSLFAPFTDGEVISGLFVALLVGFAVQGMGEKAQPVLKVVEYLQKIVFRILNMIMWVAPIGAFGGMAALIGATGWGGLGSLIAVMVGFYITCALFVFLVLGAILYAFTRVNVFKFLGYLGKEFLLILATSSSETALPRLIAKMEHIGVDKAVVGITVPTGYSFNLDGTAIYLTMSSLFIADAMGTPMSIGEQIGLLLFMMIASKGAAGVSGAGIATLTAGLQAARPDLAQGTSIVLGIDRFMSEARALTNFAGNAIATLLVGTWTKEVDRDRVTKVLAGELPFDEARFEGGE
jgi:aerobic C4-dicarboxylate transport protein